MSKPAEREVKPVWGEIATTGEGRAGESRSAGNAELLMPQDPVLRSRGGDYERYEELLRDDQVASTFQQRRLAVISSEWEVVAGDDRRESRKAADWLRETLHTIGWDNITDKMLFGVFYGFAVAECLWRPEGDGVVLSQIKVRKQRRFAFDRQGGIRLLGSASSRSQPLPPRKFWHFATGAEHDDDPYGLGLAHRLYWPVTFKRNAIKLWLVYLDKFGMPTAKGSYPPNATEEEKRRLLAALRAIQTDSGIVVPEGMDIELIEASRGGQVSYEGFVDRMNAAITKVVLSQTMTTEAMGGQYKADIHSQVRNEVVKADADLICASFNQTVVRWLTAWNFPTAKPPQVWRRVSDAPDLKPLAERDRLLYEMGFQPTLEYIHATYGNSWRERGETKSP